MRKTSSLSPLPSPSLLPLPKPMKFSLTYHQHLQQIREYSLMRSLRFPHIITKTIKTSTYPTKHWNLHKSTTITFKHTLPQIPLALLNYLPLPLSPFLSPTFVSQSLQNTLLFVRQIGSTISQTDLVPLAVLLSITTDTLRLWRYGRRV